MHLAKLDHRQTQTRSERSSSSKTQIHSTWYVFQFQFIVIYFFCASFCFSPFRIKQTVLYDFLFFLLLFIINISLFAQAPLLFAFKIWYRNNDEKNRNILPTKQNDLRVENARVLFTVLLCILPAYLLTAKRTE